MKPSNKQLGISCSSRKDNRIASAGQSLTRRATQLRPRLLMNWFRQRSFEPLVKFFPARKSSKS